ncbi:hypothetical protein MANES_09G037800v8 [Manihot esculenta]|uniref:Uncharacterized protein n=1 Tax=Manihot esculenta TaxID=3983 RepID=A0ACB7H3V2_MANES|nr:hypothetical protein MANES_09G037800v8 [Manihot esculenta]
MGKARKREGPAPAGDSFPTQEEDPITLLSSKAKKTKKAKLDSELSLVGDPIPAAEARKKWPLRYKSQNKLKKGGVPESANGESGEEEDVLQAKSHYTQAMVDGVLYKLGDDAYVKADDGNPDYIARIVELFETTEGEPYFNAQWFYRIEDTVIKDYAQSAESKRVFLSEIKDDNPLNCIVSKIKIALVAPNMDLAAKEQKIPPCDLYYDMKFTLPFLTFQTMKTDNSARDSGSSSTISSESDSNNSTIDVNDAVAKPSKAHRREKSELYLLDLYSGCGAMSTGLCMGASLSGVKLVTRWAVDINPNACKSLKINHPETEVRNEAAEDFLFLLKEWEKLCRNFSLLASEEHPKQSSNSSSDNEEDEEDQDNDCANEGSEIPSEEFEVEKLLTICYGDPNKTKKRGIYFKVRWKGYGPSEDTWEPIEGLSKCKEKLKEFVTKGYRSNILPLPGNADFICGGPPCQGISGFNRFRNTKAPLDDPKNHQLVVFMDIVDYLKPKYVLMENVVDILKFAGGFLGRYALGRLISMNYQARLGMMAAGSYGLPQFRMRVFLWGSHPSESLPQYPLPTHEVVARGGIPNEFEVTNDESQDERRYGTTCRTDFQRYIRLKRNDVVGYTTTAAQNVSSPRMLYDHRPLKLNTDDYERVCRIPKKKGANFRDLPGVSVGPDNKVEWDQSMERVMLPSGKPLVPDYAMKFVRGTSTKPFGRLWWDEIVATVVTRAEPHNQVVLHPVQDRVLTIRENARLQGFPDCYKLYGPIKERSISLYRYIQVGNAVAVPVATALGYSFGMAWQGFSDDEPLTALPFKFPSCLERSSSTHMEEDDSD